MYALPHMAEMADDICIVKSLVTEAINHDPAHTFMNTGTTISGRPSMGSWLTYGLGSEADDLPGFVVLTSYAGGRSPQPISNRMWSSGFLPGKFQGIKFNSTGSAHCLVVDINLGGDSGLELAEHPKVSNGKIPVIFISGAVEDRVRERARAAGCIALLSKPFKPVELLDAIFRATQDATPIP